MCLVNTEKEQGQGQRQTGEQQEPAAAGRGGKLTNASRASTFTTLTSTTSDESSQQPQTNTINQRDSNSNSNSNSKTRPSLKAIFSWCILTLLSKEFSVFLPKFQSHAGAKTFIPAAYHYDEENTFFDNTILTWGTDYAICLIMLYAAYLCLNATTTHPSTKLIPTDRVIRMDSSKSQALRIKSACLFFSYALSVFAGGYAHYTFTGGVNQLNTQSFRIWWSICVGSVTAAGGFMGACGSEICKKFNEERSQRFFRLVYVPDLLWMIYGGYLTWVCLTGGISYKRPACDIFVAGTSQFVPTVYCILAVGSVRWKKQMEKEEEEEERGWNGTVVHGAIRRWFRCMFYIGFALNAPLLPSYPCYIQYTSLSLGVVNAILHLNLTLAWGMQALSLRHICQAFNLVEEEDGNTISAASPKRNDNKQKHE